MATNRPTQPDPENGGGPATAPAAAPTLRSRLKHEASEKGMEAAFFKDSDLLGRMKDEAANRSRLVVTLLLAYQSLGVIYGDIGTSVLYVYPSIFSGEFKPGYIDGSDQLDQDVLLVDICGALSLIFWTLTLLALLKYIAVVLRANDTGEGGTVALYALICRTMGISPFGVYHKDEHKQMKMMKSAAQVGPRRPDLSENRFRNQVKEDKQQAKKKPKKPPREPWFRSFKWPHGVCVLDGSRIIKSFRRHVFLQRLLLGACLWATGLVIGDGILMPAFSVVSAIQGLQENTDGLTQSDLVGISIGIIILLFLLQHVGTERISFLFSPVIIIWLICNFAVGINNLSIHGGQIFQGLSPHYIILWFGQRGRQGWEALGGVMLAITGTETMFAAMGHFTQPSIATAFGLLSYPCLIITYLGQGAYLLDNPKDIDTAFWSSIPKPFFWPMLVLATLAAVVASQAVITGTFSIVRQAMSLGIFPRMHIIHTGRKIEGQIFIPVINYTLMICCVAVTAGFNANFATLGHAYGVAVMMVMVVTTCMVTLIMLVTWEWSLIIAVPWVLGLLFLEGGFLSANLFKVPNGGWFTLAVATFVTLVMLLWWWGQLKRRRIIVAQSKGPIQDVFVVRNGFQRNSFSAILKQATSRDDAASPMAVTSAGYNLASAVKDPNQVSGDSPNKSTFNSANPSQHGAFEHLTPEDVAVLMAAAAQVAPSTVMANTFQRNSSIREDPYSMSAIQGGSVVQAGIRRQISATDAVMPITDPTATTPLPSAAQVAITTSALNVESAAGTPTGGVTPTGGSTTGRGPPGLGRLSKMSAGNKTGPPGLRTDSQNPGLAAQASPALGAVSMSKGSSSSTGPGLGRLSANAKAAAKAAMQVFASQQSHTDGQKAAQQALQLVSDLSMAGAPSAAAAPNGDPAPAPTTAGPAAAPPGHLLSLQSNPAKALARLGGVGIYYSDNPTGIPPVMRHFLRNIDAMHDVVVFLSVRFLPMPSINPSERLLIRAVQGVPNFYQVVSRYGYQDVVDHRRPFVAQIVSTIMHRLELKSGLKYMGMEDDFIHEMEGETVADDDYNSRSVQNLGPLEVVHENDHEDRPSVAGPVPPRMSVDSAHRFRSPSLEHPHSRTSLTNMCPESAPAVTRFAMESLERMRQAATVPNSPQASQDAYRAAQCLVKAANEGVVYYLGRTWTRTNNDKNIAYQLVLGTCFRVLELLSYQDSEAWSIPLDNMVELGMALQI